jgi:hypothetical protein
MDMISKNRSTQAAFDSYMPGNDDTLHHGANSDTYMHTPDFAVHCSVNPDIIRRYDVAFQYRAFGDHVCRHLPFGFDSVASSIQVFSKLMPLGKQGQLSRCLALSVLSRAVIRIPTSKLSIETTRIV